MTVDLWALAITAVWSLVLTLPAMLGVLTAGGGSSYALGNRDGAPPSASDWVGRAQRAHRNMVENIGPFAMLVLVAHLAGKNNAITAAASVTFLALRVLHAIVYIAGITKIRTVIFLGSVVSLLVIFSQLLS